MKKGISVIIPTYNREQFIEETIQSILKQDYDGFLEIIVADDGSQDKTIPIAERFGNRVKIIKKPESCTSQGVASTRNRGIKASTQPFISFLDSDDFYLPDRFRKMIPAFESEPDLGFVFCRILELKEINNLRLFRPWTHNRILEKDIKHPVVSRSRVVHTNSFIFRKEVFEETGYFNENYTNGEDGDLWMRISEKFRGAFVDHFGAVYRIGHGTSQLTDNPQIQTQQFSLLIFKKALERYYEFGLKDSFRHFKLKHIMLHNLYRNNNVYKYCLYYFLLICKHPISYLNEFRSKFHEFLDRKKRQEWHNLGEYIH